MSTQGALARPYQALSLTARLAVALNCAERICAALHISDPEITRFFDYLWRFPALPKDEFASWEAARPRLLDAVLDDAEIPGAVRRVVDAAGLGPLEFVALLKCCTDIIW